MKILRHENDDNIKSDMFLVHLHVFSKKLSSKFMKILGHENDRHRAFNSKYYYNVYVIITVI